MKKKYTVTYAHTSYYTKEFEANSPAEAMAEQDWGDGGNGQEWVGTDGNGIGVVDVEEQQ